MPLSCLRSRSLPVEAKRRRCSCDRTFAAIAAAVVTMTGLTSPAGRQLKLDEERRERFGDAGAFLDPRIYQIRPKVGRCLSHNPDGGRSWSRMQGTTREEMRVDLRLKASGVTLKSQGTPCHWTAQLGALTCLRLTANR